MMTENSMTLLVWLEQHSGEDFLRMPITC